MESTLQEVEKQILEIKNKPELTGAEKDLLYELMEQRRQLMKHKED